MQELEKILEEIKDELKDIYLDIANNYNISDLQYDGDKVACVASKFRCDAGRRIEKIIRKHMNDGWIPVEERLPTMEEYQKDDGRFILDDGNRRCAGYFNVHTGRFYSYKHITQYMAELHENNWVIAWRPLPEPYHPERSDK